MGETVQAIVWSEGGLKLLDQRLLPRQEQYIECHCAEAVAEAISQMVVRGAPAIGIAAAYGLALEARRGGDLEAARKVLAASRPTAVNLKWALDRLSPLLDRDTAAESLLEEAQRIHEEDVRQNIAMAELGAGLLPEQATVLTHCNTGALATGGHGTALGVIRTAWHQKKIRQVYNTETRPWLQGSRLTSWELMREGIPSRLIADSAAAHLMRDRKIDWVIVGADRIAANGDTANKVGTYALAVAARMHGVKFMVVAPSGTFDLDCDSGDGIPIETRESKELVDAAWSGVGQNIPETWNPVFDVTPASLIDSLVCEKGVIHRPDSAQVAQLFRA